MLLAALFVVVWLRLALPVLNFGQPMVHVMNDVRATSTMMQHMDDAVATDTHLPKDQRCRETMPGCDAYLQGLCPFAPVFVLTGCASIVSPWLAQAAPPPLAADDLSPPGSGPKIPPRP